VISISGHVGFPYNNLTDEGLFETGIEEDLGYSAKLRIAFSGHTPMLPQGTGKWSVINGLLGGNFRS
jgi:hypothetical protein